ncbi:MAG: 4-hydroxy-3-methylbut-2-enyl diphosphate reductase, partial [Ruminococcaceae bacterium]|nr:4-hydroxy-3-methylbut-2-enyl diphosphate reductase [Oscillospiraceae bacterium]
MNIRIAEHAGFCFGVRRATDALENEIVRAGEEGLGRRVCTLGRIIHNDVYVNRIKSLGVEEISRGDIPSIIESADRGERITVVVRAHGELKSILRELQECDARNDNFTLLDCTCPYVRKVRQIAQENSGVGKLFVLLGDEKHPEVEGILSCAEGETIVFADSNDTERYLNSLEVEKNCGKIIAVAAQTTQNLAEWKKSINFIKKVYTNALIFDTICSVTQMRQEEAEALAMESDIMIVIGSQDSSNSRKLRDISEAHCDRVYFVTDVSECPKIDFSEIKKDGKINLSITAGASTPYSLIQEVYKTMNEQTFAELLESSFKTLNTGDIVEGVITSISQNEIHLDLGAKTTGVIVHDKATDDPQAKLEALYKVGDVIKAKVVKV